MKHTHKDIEKNSQLEDLETILGPASMLDARLDQTLFGSLFDLDIDIESDSKEQSSTPKALH